MTAVLSQALLDGGLELPWRIRALGAVLPLLCVAVVVAGYPTPANGAAAVLALAPWLFRCLGGVRIPTWTCLLMPVAGVAWMMSSWTRTQDDLSLMLLVYVAGDSGILKRPRTSAIAWLLCIAVPIGWQVGSGYDRSAAWVIGMTFAWACGLAFRKQQETLVRLQRAQQELAAKAVGEERSRIAREVHDLVAHSLAVTMLHLTGARLALADGEMAEAEAALTSAERLGRSSMAGIRRAVGLLSDPGADPSWAPEPDERDVAVLVEDYRRAGATITLHAAGDSNDADPDVGLAVFRVVQESLANAVRHAPGQPVEVLLRWREHGVDLTVTNPVAVAAPRSADGHGLTGMRERVESLGGAVSAGPSDGTWCVSAAIPLTSRVEAERA